MYEAEEDEELEPPVASRAPPAAGPALPEGGVIGGGFRYGESLDTIGGGGVDDAAPPPPPPPIVAFDVEVAIWVEFDASEPLGDLTVDDLDLEERELVFSALFVCCCWCCFCCCRHLARRFLNQT